MTERRLVLFDLDGVLTSRDTFATLVTRQLLRSPARLVLAIPALPAMHATGGWPSLRGRISRYLVRVALLGLSLPVAQRMSREVGVEFAGSPRLRRDAAVEAARRHVADGDRVVVVTATEHGLARAFLDELGLSEVELCASQLAAGRGGVRLEPHNYGRRKLDALLALRVPQPWALMYSDSWADHVLLDEVDTVVLVEPSARLLAKANRRWGPRLLVMRSHSVEQELRRCGGTAHRPRRTPR